MRVPRKIIVILEGESLANDATSFISFRFAVAAVMTGSFSLAEASTRFLVVAAGGICVGLAAGWLATQVQRRLDDPPVQTMPLLTPYVAYFAGEPYVSGILAVVIAACYGWHAPRILRGRMRPGAGSGEMVVHSERSAVHAHRSATAWWSVRSLPTPWRGKARMLVLAAIVLVRFA
jgi:CPA1 family monovalent cation:H+ antiporter